MCYLSYVENIKCDHRPANKLTDTVVYTTSTIIISISKLLIVLYVIHYFYLYLQIKIEIISKWPVV